MVTNVVSELGKFSYRPSGTSILQGTLSYRGEARGALYLFMDPEWESYHMHTTDQCTRMRKASAKLTIGGTRGEGKGEMSSAGEEMKDDKRYDSKQWKFTWTIEHRVRTYGYYLVVADCTEDQAKRYKVMEYDLTFLNDKDDHFPADEHGLFTLYVGCFLCLAGYAAYKFKNKRNSTAKLSEFSYLTEGPPTAATTLLQFGYACELISLWLEILHLWWYSSNGYGVFGFDFFSEVFEGVAQTSLGYLLLAFACGWTLIEGAITLKNEGPINPEALGEDHAATLFITFLTLGTVMLQILNKVVLFDEFAKFHDHESWPGYILVAVRAVLAVVFTVSIAQTIRYQTKRAGAGGKQNHTLRFMKQLAFFGGLWFWVFPILVAVASVCAHYVRHRLVGGGVLFLQTTCLLVLTRQITKETSSYSKASTHGGVVLGEESQKSI